MKQHRLAAVLLALIALSCAARGLKLIDLSWHCPDVGFLEEHLLEMEKTTPLDGLTIAFEGTPVSVDGKEYLPKFWNAWGKTPWKREYFRDFVTRMKKIRFRNFRDNFLYLTTNEADFDWFNDKDWEAVAANFGIAASIAREIRLKGFLLDIEQYGIHFWEYDEKKQAIPFAEAEKVAFKRGQQWGEQVFRAFPHIIIFMPYAFSFGKKNLSNAFINGILDVMPSQALLYEGDEGNSYRAKNRATFRKLRENLDNAIQNDVYPRNRKKAQRQVKLSPGFYIDAYFHHPDGSYWPKFFQPEISAAQTRVQFFTGNLKEAAAVADTYVWFYSEKRCWWWKHGKKTKLDEVWDYAPNAKGLTPAIRDLKKLYLD